MTPTKANATIRRGSDAVLLRARGVTLQTHSWVDRSHQSQGIDVKGNCPWCWETGLHRHMLGASAFPLRDDA